MENRRETMVYGGITREYLLTTPSHTNMVPLVVALHGYTDNAANFRETTGFDAFAERYGFAVVYPQGSKDAAGNHFWQVGYTFHQQETVDDEGFLLSLVAHLQQTHGFDRQRTFLTGMSNGGDMAFVLAGRHPEVFAAIASVVGTLLCDWVQAHPTPPAVALLAMNGTADTVTRYAGDLTNQDGWGAYISTPAVTEYWLRGSAVQVQVLTDPQGIDVRAVEVLTTGQDAGRQMWYRVLSGGHEWYGRTDGHFVDATDHIVRFFLG